VIIEPVTDEIVTFLDGKARLTKSYYSDLSVEWLENSLGAISIVDNELTTETAGNSLAKVSYNTRHHLYNANPLIDLDKALVWIE